jgi:outer membrane receptor protein involved in Fe transport
VLRQRQNAGTIEATGLEVDGRYAVNDSLSLRGALSATDARVDGGTAAAQLTGLRPAQAPIWSATAGLEWSPMDRLTLSADARWESRRFEDDLNSRALEAAATVDARVEWAVSPSATLWLAADNLFGADVEVAETGTGVASFGPLQTLRVGIRLAR